MQVKRFVAADMRRALESSTFSKATYEAAARDFVDSYEAGSDGPAAAAHL